MDNGRINKELKELAEGVKNVSAHIMIYREIVYYKYMLKKNSLQLNSNK